MCFSIFYISRTEKDDRSLCQQIVFSTDDVYALECCSVENLFIGILTFLVQCWSVWVCACARPNCQMDTKLWQNCTNVTIAEWSPTILGKRNERTIWNSLHLSHNGAVGEENDFHIVRSLEIDSTIVIAVDCLSFFDVWIWLDCFVHSLPVI